MAASNGNDGNTGTQSAPFKTLERGLGVLMPGETLYVRGGTYQGFYSTLKIPSGNSWSQPVTVKAYNKEKVVLTAPPVKSPLHFNDGSRYIIVDGFIMDAKGGDSGIGTGHDSHHIRILNGEVMNAPNSGVISHSGSSAFEFINLRIHDNGNNGSALPGHGVYLSTSSNLIKDCLVYNNAGFGISLYSGGGHNPSYNRILNNKVYSNAQSGKGVGISIYHGTGNSAINNIVWGHNKTGIDIQSGATQAFVYNNTIYNEAYGIYVGDYTSGSKVFNNLISSSSFYGLVIKPNSTNAEIKNNLVYGSGSGRDILNQATATILSKNLEGTTYNPRFQNLGGFDFHLQSGSPAIDAGLGLSEVGEDFDHISRPRGSSHDIGAYEKP